MTRLAPGRLSLFVVAAFALCPARPASARAPARLRQLAAQYCQVNNLPMRVANLDAGGRSVERLIVPVLANTAQSFAEIFGVANGALTYRSIQQDPVHATISIGAVGYYRYSSGAYRDPNANPQLGTNYAGRYLALGLPRAELDHLLNFWATDGLNWNNYVARRPGERQHAGCMWWLVSAEVGPGQSLWHRLGVSRSNTPANLLPKLIHAGNDWVGPVGVPVNTVAEFNAMTEQQLLGPPPAGGAVDAVR
ncbi:MAG: hypothetical protein IT371_22465 [Deltaproteobacteria bacterium]|nr:hypothetical protein [Deltaproteobacteria bacterium]